jgi:hypothetical protein
MAEFIGLSDRPTRDQWVLGWIDAGRQRARARLWSIGKFRIDLSAVPAENRRSDARRPRRSARRNMHAPARDAKTARARSRIRFDREEHRETRRFWFAAGRRPTESESSQGSLHSARPTTTTETSDGDARHRPTWPGCPAARHTVCKAVWTRPAAGARGGATCVSWSRLPWSARYALPPQRGAVCGCGAGAGPAVCCVAWKLRGRALVVDRVHPSTGAAH